MNIEAITISCQCCGAALELQNRGGIVKCQYCGGDSILPRFVTKDRMEAYNNAIKYARACEFKKATKMFEELLVDFSQEAELHWEMLMCKYGIYYVDDTRTGEKLPTLLQINPTPVTTDIEYQQAIQYASTDDEKTLYTHRANMIQRIQSEYAKIVQKEKPYDIFISYKESDDSTGGRTEDSVIAHQIYDKLTAKGYRVFYSRVSLREVAGDKYEPHIFVALTRARYMLLVTTSVEHVESTWVKNEWSRYLHMMQTDSDKHLALVFKNVNPYSLPAELSTIQGVDYSAMGADMDIVTAIDRAFAGKRKGQEDAQAASRLKTFIAKEIRAQHYDEAYNACQEYFKKYSDDAWEVHLNRLLASEKISSVEELPRLSNDFRNHFDYLCVKENCKDEKWIHCFEQLEAQKYQMLCEQFQQEIKEGREREAQAEKRKALSFAENCLGKDSIKEIKAGLTYIKRYPEDSDIIDMRARLNKKIAKINRKRTLRIIRIAMIVAFILFTIISFIYTSNAAKPITEADLTEETEKKLASLVFGSKWFLVWIVPVVIGIAAAALFYEQSRSRIINIMLGFIVFFITVPIALYYILWIFGLINGISFPLIFKFMTS